jgi:hypothetical protein
MLASMATNATPAEDSHFKIRIRFATIHHTSRTAMDERVVMVQR